MTDNCDICKHLENTSGELLRTDHWIVALAPDQGYLGRCYVTLREHKASLSDISQEEWAEFGSIVPRLESACAKAFGADPFNWACMMNNAYQVKPSLPHVHWHFRPRYEQSVTVNGVEFVDPLYGYHYDREQRNRVDSETYQKIVATIKSIITGLQSSG